ILALDILGSLHLINFQKAIDFIWSCYNPEGNENGFIGQPYDASLEKKFKVATADNTYFAIQALDILLNDWNAYNMEITRIIQYINSLQSTETSGNLQGGFFNDLNQSLSTLGGLYEPNIYSSFYCVKILETFNMINTIRMGEFHQYMNDLYQQEGDYFNYAKFFFPFNFTNVVATAVGLDLSNLTGYTNSNKINSLNFVYQYRNNLGGWDASSLIKYHELIDTFQIVRSLINVGEIDTLTSGEIDEISSFIELFHHPNQGYSLISEDYMMIDLIYTSISSFESYGRVMELDIENLYSLLINSYRDSDGFEGFYSCTKLDLSFAQFRSQPLETVLIGKSDQINLMMSHKANYKALSSLLKIFKLDNFATRYDLNPLIQRILNSQFLDLNYENYGAFLPSVIYGDSSFKNDLITIESSYYAIQLLKILVDYLSLGNFTDIAFNKFALYDFIFKNVEETDSELYYNQRTTQKTENVLENTYYMISILKDLNLYGLNSQKIRSFVLNHIDYLNLKNVYYSFKILELLNSDTEIDYQLTQNLVKSVFSENIGELYLNPNLKVIEQDAFLWICEMAQSDNHFIETSYFQSIKLGSVNTMTTTINNLILDYYGPYLTVVFESNQLGSYELELDQDKMYKINFLVPEEPNCYPLVEGVLKFTEGSTQIYQHPISFQTTFNQTFSYQTEKQNNNLNFELNISRTFSSGAQPLMNTNIYVDVFLGDYLIETLQFDQIDYIDYSYFYLNNTFLSGQDIYFDVYLKDDYFPDKFQLFDYSLETIPERPPEPNLPNITITGPTIAISSLALCSVITASIVPLGRKMKKRKSKRYIQEKGQKEKLNMGEDESEEIQKRLKSHFFKNKPL
ncbi:MAG: prenyltransferase/squalene oxidase repeat-containing protein, partial [Promethearchaeota archaeon]